MQRRITPLTLHTVWRTTMFEEEAKEPPIGDSEQVKVPDLRRYVFPLTDFLK